METGTAPVPDPGLPPAADGADAGQTLYVTPLGGGRGLRIAGEVDIFSLGRFERALEGLVPAAAGEEITLEMGELGFVNVAGVRAVVRAAERWPTGWRMVLRHPPRALQLASMLFPESHVRIEVIPR